VRSGVQFGESDFRSQVIGARLQREQELLSGLLLIGEPELAQADDAVRIADFGALGGACLPLDLRRASQTLACRNRPVAGTSPWRDPPRQVFQKGHRLVVGVGLCDPHARAERGAGAASAPPAASCRSALDESDAAPADSRQDCCALSLSPRGQMRRPSSTPISLLRAWAAPAVASAMFSGNVPAAWKFPGHPCTAWQPDPAGRGRAWPFTHESPTLARAAFPGAEEADCYGAQPRRRTCRQRHPGLIFTRDDLVAVDRRFVLLDQRPGVYPAKVRPLVHRSSSAKIVPLPPGIARPFPGLRGSFPEARSAAGRPSPGFGRPTGKSAPAAADFSHSFERPLRLPVIQQVPQVIGGSGVPRDWRPSPARAPRSPLAGTGKRKSVGA